MKYQFLPRLRFSLSPLLALALLLYAPVESASAQTAAPESLPEFQHAFPIATPTYEGVEQLMVLSDRWIVVVTSTEPEVVNEIDKLSGGKFLPVVNQWKATRDTARPNWTARSTMQKLRDQYIALARINVGESDLDKASAYRIGSPTDTRYATHRVPVQVGRTLVGLGDNVTVGGPEVDYAHYSYLRVPQALVSGNTYTVSVSGKKKATFLFDTNRTVSRAIKVNQVGYLPDAPRKYAYLGCHIYGVGPLDGAAYSRFEVVNASTGAVAFSGRPVLRDANSRVQRLVTDTQATELPPLITGENVYEMDFTGLKGTGHFFIRIPGVGRSWPFYHGADAYGEVFFTSARGLFHQRCNIALKAPHTNWPRIRCHTAPVYESDLIAFAKGTFNPPEGYNRFDIIGGSIDLTRSTTGVAGGWHDAADWDRNNNHYTVLFDLLNAYGIAPESFADSQLNIPESGNGVPDILDEAAYGLQVWRHSMNTEGGVSGFVETNTHPSIDAASPYAFSRRTRWDSLLFAAAAAQLGEYLKPFDASSSARWAWYANRAYSYGMNPKNSLGVTDTYARSNRGAGDPYVLTWEEREEYLDPFILHAKVRLYRSTGRKDYLNGVPELLAKVRRPFHWPYSLMDYSPWIFYGLVDQPGILGEAERAKLIKSHFTDFADSLLANLEGMPYRCTWPRNRDYWMAWGASDMTNSARALITAYELTGDPKYRDGAILNFDYMLGVNPMGMSWTTGVGYSYPTDIQHAVSQHDGIADPVPGITIYGITGGMFGMLRDTVWRSPGGVLSNSPVDFKVSDVPLWRRWSSHPIYNTAQCEFTIQESISSNLFCAAALLPAGWKPTAALKNRRPRPKSHLYGTYYLP